MRGVLFRGHKKEECIFFVLFVFCLQINCHIITELVFVLYFHFVLKLQQRRAPQLQQDRTHHGVGFFFWILILQVEFCHFSTILDVVHALLPHKYRKSHACFEARSNKRYPEKYTECTYKHKKKSFIYIYIYIFLYIYIYGPSQENGETIMHKRSSRSEMSKQTEKKAKPGR